MHWLVGMIVILCFMASTAMASEPKLESDDQNAVYALGLIIATNLEQYALSADEVEILKSGLSDGLLGREPKVNLSEWGPKMQQFATARAQASAEAEKAAGEKFLNEMAGEKGAVKYDSGLIMREIKAGSGASPSETDTVKVHYHGTLRDGSVFDSSVERGTPATFPLNGVIPCWTEGVQRMKVGGKSKLVCPASIAYGDRGAPPRIRPGAALVFEVELLEVVKADAAAEN